MQGLQTGVASREDQPPNNNEQCSMPSVPCHSVPAMLTNPKPRGLPVSRSVMTLALEATSGCANESQALLLAGR